MKHTLSLNLGPRDLKLLDAVRSRVASTAPHHPSNRSAIIRYAIRIAADQYGIVVDDPLGGPALHPPHARLLGIVDRSQAGRG